MPEIVEVPTDQSTASNLPYYTVGQLIWHGSQVARVLSCGPRSAALELIPYATGEQRKAALTWDPMRLQWAPTLLPDPGD